MFLRGIAEASYQEAALRKSIEGTRAEDIMIRDVVAAPADLPVKGLISDYFLRYGYRGFPVTTGGNGEVLGLISLANVKDLSEDEQARRTVGQIMAPLAGEMIIRPETPLSEGLNRMTHNDLGRLVVMRGDQMVGMVTRTGLLRHLEMKQALVGGRSREGHHGSERG
jgi:CBS domain-containing protein